MSAIDPLILALDLRGTFVFALSGAALGARERVDLFGVLILALPAAINDGRHLAVSVLAGLIVFRWGVARFAIGWSRRHRQWCAPNSTRELRWPGQASSY